MSPVWEHMRNMMLRGLLALVPIGLTFWIISLIYVGIDQRIAEQVARVLPFRVPGLGLLLFLATLYLVGLLMSNYLGKAFMGLVESLSQRIPIVRTTWNVGKQIAASLSPDERKAFERAVLVPYLRDDQWTVAFVCGSVTEEGTGARLVKCFIPIPPNPATGWVVFVEEAKVRDPGWTMEEAMKAVVSLGIISPDQVGPPPS